MIIMHMAYGLYLIAATAGTALLVWSMKNPGKGSWLGKLIGALVLILSIVCIICIASCAAKGGECHRWGQGEGMGMMMQQPAGPGEEAHDHMAKKAEHKK